MAPQKHLKKFSLALVLSHRRYQVALIAVCIFCLVGLYSLLKSGGNKSIESIPTFAKHHEWRHVSDRSTLKALTDLKEAEYFLQNFVDPMLYPREVGTQGHLRAHEFIARQLKLADWSVEFDNFTSQTPFGAKTFSNIIATYDTRATNKLVLSAHFDSKVFPFKFDAATDSAVPCGMLLEIAATMAPILKDRYRALDTTLQLVFFDGEEAFGDWTESDSIYGSRHLAELWEKQRQPEKNTTKLQSIEMFMLLDLLGAKEPSFYHAFPDTWSTFEKLIQIESNLRKHKLLTPSSNPKGTYFQPSISKYQVEDDHKPFLKRGVPVLHLIAIPFPPVWHKQDDNRQNLDLVAINNLRKIFRVFVYEYLRIA